MRPKIGLSLYLLVLVILDWQCLKLEFVVCYPYRYQHRHRCEFVLENLAYLTMEALAAHTDSCYTIYWAHPDSMFLFGLCTASIAYSKRLLLMLLPHWHLLWPPLYDVDSCVCRRSHCIVHCVWFLFLKKKETEKNSGISMSNYINVRNEWIVASEQRHPHVFGLPCEYGKLKKKLFVPNFQFQCLLKEHSASLFSSSVDEHAKCWLISFTQR